MFRQRRRQGAAELVAKIEGEVDRACNKTFVKHYFSRYSEPYLPPSWSVCECVTFGLWFRTYQLLKNSDDRKAISRRFNVDATERDYRKAGIRFSDSKSFYAVATVINYLLRQTGLPLEWSEELKALFAKYPEVDLAEIGFPIGWRNRPGWL